MPRFCIPAVLPRLGRTLRRFRHDVRGNIAIMSALFLPVSIGLTALAVDSGSLYLERRETQNLADLAAIYAAANLDQAEKAAMTVLRDNGFGGNVLLKESSTLDDLTMTTGQSHLYVETGNYEADPEIEPDKRFQPGKTPTNAVQVTLRRPGTQFFSTGIMGSPTIGATGIAHATAEAAFTVGSRLARVEDGILNQLLNSMLGTSISLTAMDYEALLDADVEAVEFLDTMASKMELKAGTYDDVLDSSVDIGTFAGVMAGIARGSASAKTALGRIASDGASRNVELPLTRVFDLGTLGNLRLGTATSAFEGRVGVMQLLTAGAAIANGDRQVELDLSSSVPDAARLDVALAIGERAQESPWFRLGEKNSSVKTAQTRLRIQLTVGGTGKLAGTTVKLPLYVDLAQAEAKLNKLSCPTGRVQSADVEIDAKPGVANVWIGAADDDDLTAFDDRLTVDKAMLVDAPLFDIYGRAHAEISNSGMTRLDYDYTDIRDLKAQTVSTRELVKPLLNTLLGELELTVKASGFSLTLPDTLTDALVDNLTPLAEPFDTAFFNLLDALGVSIGQADVTVHGVRCQRSVLVQ